MGVFVCGVLDGDVERVQGSEQMPYSPTELYVFLEKKRLS